MLAARAWAVLALAAGGWTLVNVAFGQQAGDAAVPVEAMVEAATQPLGSPLSADAVWMPSRVAGHLADRLEALHEPLPAAQASPTKREAGDVAEFESAARTPPGSLVTYQSRSTAAPQPSSLPQAGVQPAREPKAAVSSPLTIRAIVPTPTAAAKPAPAPQPAARPVDLPRRNPVSAAQTVFGAANPLRGDR